MREGEGLGYLCVTVFTPVDIKLTMSRTYDQSLSKSFFLIPLEFTTKTSLPPRLIMGRVISLLRTFRGPFTE